MTDLLDRLDRLEALVAAPPAGGPAQRISSDYASGGSGKSKGGGKGGGRHVASKAGEKRYGLPIGTPLGGTHSKGKGDKSTQRSYAMFQSAKTPADMRAYARWMSNDDLGKAAEALFSFNSKNERDEAARMVLVRELAERGIDAHGYGYKGGPIAVNPNPKKDPTTRKAEKAEREAAKEAKEAAREAQREQRDKERDEDKRRRDEVSAAKEAIRKQKEAKAEADRVARTAMQTQAQQADTRSREQAAQALIRGNRSEAEVMREWRHRTGRRTG
jgi:hypothetical protein